MRKTTENGVIVLTTDDDHVLTNGAVYGKTIYLGINDKAENWHEITDAEYEVILAEQEAKAKEAARH